MNKYVMIRVLATSRDQLNEIASLTGKTQIDVVTRLANDDLMGRFDSDGVVAEALRGVVVKGDSRSDEELVVLLSGKAKAHVSQVTILRRLWQ